jgi:hypothetical protein
MKISAQVSNPPMQPLKFPCKKRKNTRAQKDFDKPKPNIEIASPRGAKSKIGFRPK